MKRNRHGRYCSETIGFRNSPEENKQINVAVSLSGLTKQEYITSKLLDREIHVQPNSKVHRAVYNCLTEVLEELQRIQEGGQIDDELMDNINLIAGFIDRLYLKNNV